MDSVRIIVNIDNRYEIYRTIVDTIPYMNGWKVDSNANEGNHHWGNALPKYFAFDISNKNFCWLVPDDCPSEDAMDSMTITDLAEISRLLDFINEVGDTFVTPDAQPTSEELAKAFEEFFKDGSDPKDKAQADLARYVEKIKKEAEAQANTDSFGNKLEKSLMEQLIAVQPMNMPSGQVFYMDYVYGPGTSVGKSNVESEIVKKMSKKMAAMYAQKELNPTLYTKMAVGPTDIEAFQAQMDKILSCQSLDELSKMLIKLEGKHDDWSEQLKKAIHNRANKLNGVIAHEAFHTAGGNSLQYKATTKLKMNWKAEKKVTWPTPEEMEKISISMGNSIGKEIEEEYLKQLYSMAAAPNIKGVIAPTSPTFQSEYMGHWTSPDEAKEIAAQKEQDKIDAAQVAHYNAMAHFNTMAYLMPKNDK